MTHLKTSLMVAFLFVSLPVYGFTQLAPLNPWVPPVNYFIDNGLLTNPGGPIQQAVQDATNQWSVNGNANFTFQFGGFVNDLNYTTNNNQMTIMGIVNGAPTPAGNPQCVQIGGNSVLGFALSFSNLNNQSVDGYIVICINVINNTQTVALPWFVGVGNQLPGANMIDFVSVVTHELGHIVRLGHSCDGTLNNGIPDCNGPDNPLNIATMRFNIPTGDFNHRTIEADDIAGIQSIYGVFDPDFDDDGILNPNDNCPNAANSDQTDYDKDGTGDGCDADADGDGLSNAKEVVVGTNPLNHDTDGDGISDGDEVLKYGSSPLMKDSDEDSVEDGIEIKNGTNPAVNEATVLIVLSLLLDEDEGPLNVMATETFLILSMLLDDPQIGDYCNANTECGGQVEMECAANMCFATCYIPADCPESHPYCLGGKAYGMTSGLCINWQQAEKFFWGVYAPLQY